MSLAGMTPDSLMRLHEIRQKALSNTATLEELAEGIKILRQGRAAIPAQTKAGSRAKTAVAKPNADDLLNELDKL